MKKIMTTTCLILFVITAAFCQEKNDSYLGLNFGSSKTNDEQVYLQSNSNSDSKTKYLGVNYSRFLAKNRRLNLNVSYTDYKSNIFTSNNLGTYIIKAATNGYGAGVGYGLLFPLLKNFYAELTPGFNYSYKKYNIPENNYYIIHTDNSYSITTSGGVLWVPFKHFGLSANLATISFEYTRQKSESDVSIQQVKGEKSSSIVFDNQGNLQNQSFSVFYKF